MTWPPKPARCEGCGERAALDGHKRDCPWIAAVKDRRAARLAAIPTVSASVDPIDAIREAIR